MAVWIRQTSPQRTERLAHHAIRGEAWEAAHHYAMEAGLRAAAFGVAANALARLPETEERLGEAVDLRFHMCDALFVLGGRPRVRAQMDLA